MNGYRLASAGGEHGGRSYPGYEGLVNSHLNRDSVEKLFFTPLREWILRDGNFDSGQRGAFKALSKSLEQRLDAYMGKIQSDVNNQIASVEQHALNTAGEIAPEMDTAQDPPIAVRRNEVGEVSAGLGASYAAFFIEGAVVAGAIAAGVAAFMMSKPELAVDLEGFLARLPGLTAALGGPFIATTSSAAAVCGIAGGLVGGLIGILWRSFTAASARRTKLAQRFCNKVDQLLLRGYRDGVGKQVDSVRDQLLEAVDARRADFGGAVRASLDAVIQDIDDQLGSLRYEEEDLKQKQTETIARLEPKVARLKEVARQARDIANLGHGAASPPSGLSPQPAATELNV